MNFTIWELTNPNNPIPLHFSHNSAQTLPTQITVARSTSQHCTGKSKLPLTIPCISRTNVLVFVLESRFEAKRERLPRSYGLEELARQTIYDHLHQSTPHEISKETNLRTCDPSFDVFACRKQPGSAVSLCLVLDCLWYDSHEL